MQRFWEKVDTSGECWLWTATTKPDGYGQIWMPGGPQTAHRVSWELTHGPIPAGLCVLHHCDTRACVRPEHLFLGTVGDNNRDRAAKGRSSRRHTTTATAASAKARKARGACPQGHPYDEANTWRSPSGWRACRICNRLQAQARRAARA